MAVLGATGTVGRALVERASTHRPVRAVAFSSLAQKARRRGNLPEGHDLVWHQADLMSLADAEVSMAGVDTAVMLARAPRHNESDTSLAAADLLLADTVARAAARCGVRHVVLFSCQDAPDVREELFARAGVSTSILVGGGSAPVSVLIELVESTTPQRREEVHWQGPPTQHRSSSSLATSIQSFERKPGRTAAELAAAYFRWLSNEVPLTTVRRCGQVYSIEVARLHVLSLRHVPGRSEPDSDVFAVSGGALASGDGGGYLEFRNLIDERTSMVIVRGFRPALPAPLYGFAHAPVHEKLMLQFVDWLGRFES